MAYAFTRRSFLPVFAGGLAAAGASSSFAAGTRLPIRKAVYIGMLPKELGYVERFQLAREAGFEEVECATVENPDEVQRIRDAAEKTKLRIHSVMNQAHWEFPLSSPDPAVVAKSLKGMETSLRNAHAWGAETVLLVPAVCKPDVTYAQCWERSQKEIRKLLPLAAELKVIIAIEEVWNKFLLSPLEMARYVDEFKSPWVGAYYDVGNMVFYGYPQDWIRTLGKRIKKLHFKDFKFRDMKCDFVNLRDGDIVWPEVYKALADIGYKGSATVELEGGDLAYLKDVSQRVDLILEGK